MKRRATLASGLTLVNASAGSGKTHRLTQEVVAAVDPNAHDGVELEGLCAVTYTRKAAGELGVRIRRALLEAGQIAHAQRLPLAYIGTVHAVCLRLIQEHAIDAGLSPEVDVVPGNELRLLSQALDWGLDPAFKKRVDDLAYHLQLRWDPQRRRTDWITPVADIMALARGNRVAPSALTEMGVRSADRLLRLLGTPERDGAALDAALLEALEKAEQGLVSLDEDTGVWRKALKEVRDARRRAERGRLKWNEWVALQKVNAAGARGPVLTPLIQVASRVDAHPELHRELRELTMGLFEAARQGLVAYQDWKRRHRVVDYVDMIDRALTLLEEPAVAAELAGRLELLAVDEVQDTSPVQLALFLRLHHLAGRSSWVGDPKQCIFEFAGADPGLMQAVTDWVEAEGGTIERLGTNYRSRPELVQICSRVFAAAFASQGLQESDVVVAAHRKATEPASELPALGVWGLAVNNKAQEACAVAEGVQRLLAAPGKTPVIDRATGKARGLRAGDVAVVSATNAEAQAIADALARRGIRAAVARTGLLVTPEGTLVEAALRRVLDTSDSLAAAELAALQAFDGLDPDAWLDARLRAEPALPAVQARLEKLDALNAIASALTPSEVLDRTMAALDAVALAARWPDAHQRIANLEALRALAASYEERCHHEHEPATLAGLLRYFGEAAEKQWVRDEEVASDDQHVSEGEHAVTIVTYHRAKGLEWPVVVLTSLDREERRDAFDVSPETDRAALDPADPLGGRWIRYWPWPFGQQQKCGLANRAAASPEGLAVAERERRERVRLLYVGFTRARDHLVLALRCNKNGYATHWLDELANERGEPLIQIPQDAPKDGKGKLQIRGLDGKPQSFPARHWELDEGPEPPARLGDGDRHVLFARPEAMSSSRAPYRIAPSRAATDWVELPNFAPLAEERFADRIPLGSSAGVSWDVVGDTLHAFFAADVPELSVTSRHERAERLLHGAKLHGLLAPEALVTASDALRTWVDRRWTGATWHREVPVSALVSTVHGVQSVSGVIDLLLETPDGVVVIDYKGFPGAASAWQQKAEELAPQLAAYARALELAGKKVLETWLCFAVGGGAVRVGRVGAGTQR